MSDASAEHLRLFEAVGVELEYMIVDAMSFDVRPYCDRLMHAATGEFAGEVERPNGISWSNELVSHVVELKTTEPAPRLVGSKPEIGEAFGQSVRELEAFLEPMRARLLPSGMHPWMNPSSETVLWPHEYGDVYRTFDRLFDCKRHGWANLQSVHLNLPFQGDEEFGRLHAAVRLILPLLPALCASSPLMDGRTTGRLCNRMHVYASNQAAVPSLIGAVIPEPVFTREAYERVIMQPIARDVARIDPGGTMQPDWMNSRGAIARFDRGSIEIRVMDVQECPRVDIAIAAGIVGVLKWLVAEEPSSCRAQQALETARLRTVMDLTIDGADRAIIDDSELLTALGLERRPIVARDMWSVLFRRSGIELSANRALAPLAHILDHGSLACRMLDQFLLHGPARSIDHETLLALCAALAECLRTGRMLREG